MKKNIFFLMSVAVMMLASCSQNEELLQIDTSANEEVQVIFNVQMPEMKTRTTSPDETKEGTAKRYICEVYKTDNATGTPDNRLEQRDSKFTILLEKNTDYVFLLWADNGTAANGNEDGNYYNAADLKNVQVAGRTDTDNYDELAFYACKQVKISNTGEIADITLNHAVAKVCLYETNLIDANSTLEVSYNPASAFNVADGTTTVAEAAHKLEYSLTEGVTTANATDGNKIACFYVLASEKGKAEGLSDITFTLNEQPEAGDTEKKTVKTVNNVPLQANYVTNIRGEFSDYTNKGFDVVLNPNWNDDEMEKTFPDYRVDAANHAIHIYVPGSLTTEEVAQAIGDGNTLSVTGTMNQSDVETICDKYIYENRNTLPTISLLDFSKASFEGESYRSFLGSPVTEFYMPETGVTEIASNSFNGAECEIIHIPTSVTALGEQAFSYMYYLEEADLSNTKIASLPDKLFIGDRSLTAVYLGDIINMGDYVFSHNPALTTIDLSKCTTVPTITDNTFGNYPAYTTPTKMVLENVTVVVSSEKLAEFQSAWGDKGFKEIKAAE